MNKLNQMNTYAILVASDLNKNIEPCRPDIKYFNVIYSDIELFVTF
jgi:hypothetical protein